MKKNQKPFERKSRCDRSTQSYLDESFNYVYKYEEHQADGTHVTKTCVIPYAEENRDVFIFLDSADYKTGLSLRYYEESKDKVIEHRKAGIYNTASDGDSFDAIDPMESIADKNALFGNDEENPVDPRVEELQNWIQTLPKEQIDLIYMHLGECMTLEDIRRKEELETGRAITKQAMHNRWKKIVNKACKHFGVEPSKKPCK